MTTVPRAALWLLRKTLPQGDAGETIVGDLIEGWADRGGSPAASWWVWRQTLSLAVRYGGRRKRSRQQGPAETWRRSMAFDNLRHDVRYAVRSYAKAPSFTIAVLATLALGIGASTAIFSMVNGILLQPLPLRDPDRLVYINEINPAGNRISVSWPSYLDWVARARSVESLANSREEALTLSRVDRAQRLRARRVTAGFLGVIGAGPVLGSGFSQDADRPKAPGEAVVSHEFWRTRLGGDASVLGRTLMLDDVQYTVVGVLPEGFRYLRPYDLFVSMGPVSGTKQLLFRGNHTGFSAIGRLKPGLTVDAADQEFKAIAASLEREHPATNAGISTRTERLADRVVADIRLTLLALFGAVACLLLIACVNVANLLIARGAARQHELTVRAALGGGRMRLARQLLVESTLVSVAGGAIGVAVAFWLLRALIAVAPEGLPRLESVRLDVTALLFAFSAAAVCGVVFGLFPAFQASAVDGQQALMRTRSSGASARSHRLRRVLMVVETALAIVLLMGAGLMLRTLQQLTHVDTGIQTDHLLTLRLNLAGEQWTEARRRNFFTDLSTRVRAVPGVSKAALAYSLPIDGSQWNSVFVASDKPEPIRAETPSAAFSPVGDGYFDTTGMRVVRGRVIDTRDTETAPLVVVINETLANKIWPGEDAVGKRIKQGWFDTNGPWREVVGVVGDVKFNGLTTDTPMQVYLPMAQDPNRSVAVLARTAGEPTAIVPAIENIVRGLDKDLPLYSIRTMEELLDTSIAQQRMSMLVFIVFAVVALVLASVGLYGVVAHGVTERRHEIGVRMALGADRRHVLALVVRQGLSMALVGTAIGVAGALALSRTVEDLLFGVKPTDPLTFAAVVAVLLCVATVACYVPAWRATRLDPTQALRAE
jgi:putative ABC transport system permease protein